MLRRPALALLFIYCTLHCVFAGYNDKSKSQCDPVNYPNDGDGYCTGRVEGWYNGGAVDLGESFNGVDTCTKWGKQCECKDCGDGMTSCQENRCHDTEGELRWNSATKAYDCYDIGSNRIRGSGENWLDYCFMRQAKCDLSACSKGQYLSGCKRISPGTCVSCPTAVVVGRHYWGAVGHGAASCVQLKCATPTPGQFIQTACTTTTDAVVKSCAEYPGNKQAKSSMSSEQLAQVTAGNLGVFDIDRFFCPAGNVVLSLPANSIASSDYASFHCKDGFFYDKDTSLCVPCSPGSACLFGQQFTCPVNYYSKGYSSTFCTRCTLPKDCRSNRRPLRCKAGSTYDGGCVGCGSCGHSDDTGLTCVDNNYELDALKDKCSPSSTGEWNCRK